MTPANSAPPVVIVGAGVAGLTAGVRLAEAGTRVLVLDARPRLGGRATAFADRTTGEPVDNGQHVLFGAYHETLALLRTIGAAANVRIQPTLDVSYIHEGGHRSRLRCLPLPPPFHLLAGLLRWDALSWRDKLAAIRLAQKLRSARDARVDPSIPSFPSAREWLIAEGQTPRVREMLWEPLAVAALNEPVEQASAAMFAVVLSRLFGRSRQDASIVMPTVPLDRLYAEPARSFIEARGGEVRLNALARVVVDAGRVVRVRTGSDMIRSAAVISTVAWHAFANLFETPDGARVMPEPLRDVADNAARMRSMPILTVNLWYDRTVMPEQFVGLPGCTIQWVFEKRAIFGERSSHLSLIVSSAAAIVGESADDLIALAAREIASRIPGARDAKLVGGTVIRERQATFSTAQPDVTRPGTHTGLDGFFLAGDWINTGLPSTIESAVVSGNRAADALLSRDLGLGARGSASAQPPAPSAHQ